MKKILGLLFAVLLICNTAFVSANVANTNTSGIADFTDVLPGEYVITTTKDGYITAEIVILKPEPMQKEVKKVLNPVP